MHAIDRGMSLSKACDYAGIAYGTFQQWRQFGEDAIERDVDNEYSRFLIDLRRHESLFAMSAMDKITAAPTWTAAAWQLERRFPADFGARQALEVTGANGGPIQTVDLAALSQLSVEELLVLEKAKRVIDGQNNANSSSSTERLPYTPRSLPS